MNEEYLLGLSAQELKRIGYQHEAFANDTSKLIKIANLKPGDAFLDLGCGPGLVSVEAARIVGEKGIVTSVDLSEKCINSAKQIAEASGLQNLKYIQSDLNSLELKGEMFDVVFARWVFCYFQDLSKIFDEVFKSIKPGGCLVVMDYMGYDHVVAPEFKEYKPILQAVNNAFNVSGDGNLSVTLAIPEFLENYPVTIEHLEPIQRISRPGETVWEWVESFYESFIPIMVERGDLDKIHVDPFWKAWNKAKLAKHTYIFGMPIIGMVIKKDS